MDELTDFSMNFVENEGGGGEYCKLVGGLRGKERERIYKGGKWRWRECGPW